MNICSVLWCDIFFSEEEFYCWYCKVQHMFSTPTLKREYFFLYVHIIFAFFILATKSKISSNLKQILKFTLGKKKKILHNSPLMKKMYELWMQSGFSVLLNTMQTQFAGNLHWWYCACRGWQAYKEGLICPSLSACVFSVTLLYTSILVDFLTTVSWSIIIALYIYMICETLFL